MTLLRKPFESRVATRPSTLVNAAQPFPFADAFQPLQTQADQLNNLPPHMINSKDPQGQPSCPVYQQLPTALSSRFKQSCLERPRRSSSHHSSTKPGVKRPKKNYGNKSKPRNAHWTAGELRKTLRLRADGRSPFAIASVLKQSTSAVTTNSYCEDKKARAQVAVPGAAVTLGGNITVRMADEEGEAENDDDDDDDDDQDVYSLLGDFGHEYFGPTRHDDDKKHFDGLKSRNMRSCQSGC